MGRGKAQHNLALIDRTKRWLEKNQPCSVRACCYMLFINGEIADMSKGETNRVSAQIRWARENNIIPWSWIVDETREVECLVNAFENPAEYVELMKRSYRRDRWADQRERIELWSEKRTVRGTLAPVLRKYGIPFRVQHGYGSATALYDAALDSRLSSKPLVVFYVGDWDPSGLHMSEVDLPRRIVQYGGAMYFQRLALSEDDTHSGLPYFLAETKKGDTRYRWYLDRYGTRCWELDALNPATLRDRVDNAIYNRLDLEAWHRAAVAERAEQESLAGILDAWPGISGQALKYDDGDRS